MLSHKFDKDLTLSHHFDFPVDILSGGRTGRQAASMTIN